MGYGGPHAAFLACHEDVKRIMPGRIIGVSIDAQVRLRRALLACCACSCALPGSSPRAATSAACRAACAVWHVPLLVLGLSAGHHD